MVLCQVIHHRNADKLSARWSFNSTGSLVIKIRTFVICLLHECAAAANGPLNPPVNRLGPGTSKVIHALFYETGSLL